MAQHCHFCGKTPMSGHRVSHANNLTNRKWHLNVKTRAHGRRRRLAARIGLHALHPVGEGHEAQAAAESRDRPRPPRSAELPTQVGGQPLLGRLTRIRFEFGDPSSLRSSG